MRTWWLAALVVGCGVEAPTASHLEPSTIAGGQPATITIHGHGLDSTTPVSLGGEPAEVRFVSAARLELTAPASKRGTYPIVLAGGEPMELTVTNTPPKLDVPGPQLVAAGRSLSVRILATDFDDDTVQVTATGTPAGARWDGVTLDYDAPGEAAVHTVSFTADDGIDSVGATLELRVVHSIDQPIADTLTPTSAPGGEPFELTVRGSNFTAGDQVTVDGAAMRSEVIDMATIRATVSPHRRGTYDVRVERAGAASDALALSVGNSPPVITPPARLEIDERETAQVEIEVVDPEADGFRLFAAGLPAGARFDEATRTIAFTPDFIQGGDSWRIELTATDATRTGTASFVLAVRDTIQPPAPQVIRTDARPDHLRLTIEQVTDAFLDSPGHAGRVFDAKVVIPVSATDDDPLPARVFLHGFGGSPYAGGTGDQFRIYPSDPVNTYWWGYAERLPDAAADSGATPPYTLRRVLHLLEWVVRTHEGVDTERSYAAGGSMGGAGSATLALLFARHFSHVDATIGQTILRNHRPSRRDQLAGHYGTPQANLDGGGGLGVWDQLDLTRALRDDHDARNQFIYTKHGKDDPTIHFGAVVHDSPLTGLSFYDALEEYRVGHYSVWDEGGHGSADPVLGARWWDSGWHRAFDEVTFLRRNLAFIAFSASRENDEPGDGSGNGTRPFHQTRGYAGQVDTPGDTGWGGAVAGALNRWLRWDSRSIVDSFTRFEVRLFVVDGDGRDPPRAGYPTIGDRGPSSIVVDVTPRRVQRFHTMPTEVVMWSFGARSGTVAADADGAVTVPGLGITNTPTVLVLQRM